MRVGSIVLTLVLVAVSNFARASELQVAIVLDGVQGELQQPLIFELRAFERLLTSSKETVDFALVRCNPRDPSEVMVNPFGSSLRAISELPLESCAGGADLIDAAIERAGFKEGARKRIVTFGAFHKTLLTRRTTAEEAMHRAERNGIVVYAGEILFLRDGAGDPRQIMQQVQADVSRFLATPTAPLGRVPSNARHATLINGGSYHLSILRGGRELWRNQIEMFKVLRRLPKNNPDAKKLRSMKDLKPYFQEQSRAELKKLRAELDQTFGPQQSGLDALDHLAAGSKRPSEVTNAELPQPLWDLDLEPLLDAVWDYVDARRVAKHTLHQLDAAIEERPESEGMLGSKLAQEALGERRLPPSRR